MPLVETAAYKSTREKLSTRPIYLVKFAVPAAVGTGLEFPFSRSFAGPVAPVGAATEPLLYVGKVRGNTQTVDVRNGLTTRGALAIELLDVGGEITAYCSDPELGLASGLGTGTVTTITAVGDTAGYPEQGTLELIAVNGTTKERIRYSSRTGSVFHGIVRAVDGTSALAWAAATALHNGEQIRRGARVTLQAGYADLAESAMVQLGRFEIIERSINADKVTWTILVGDLQTKAAVLVFRLANQRKSIVLGPEHPALLALRVLTSATGEVATLETDLAGADNDLEYSARTKGTAGNAITVRYVNPGTPSAALSVSVVDKAITVNLKTDAASAIVTRAGHIVDAIRADAAATALVAVVNKVANTGVGVVTALAATALAGGVDGAANGLYDTLTADNGAGIDQALVDVQSFLDLQAATPGVQFEFEITAPVGSAIAWIQEQLLAPLNAFIWASPSGKLAAKRLPVTATAADAVTTLTTAQIVEAAWAAGDRDIVNVIDVSYDWLRTPLPQDENGVSTGVIYDYAKRTQYEATRSIAKYYRMPVNGDGRVLTWQGLRTALGVQAHLDDFAARMFSRWADPPAILQVKTLYTQHHLELGDTVLVTYPYAPNLRSGLRGLSNEIMQVIDVRPLFGGEGGMLLKLSTMVRSVAPSGDVFTRTTADLSVSTVLPAVTNFTAAQLQQNVIFTWKAVAGAVDYQIREGATWDGGKVVAQSVTGVSWVLDNVLDAQHTYRIRAFRSPTDFSPETTAILSTTDNDKGRNVTIDRDEVALAFPGTKTGVAFIAELTPDALTNMAGLWFSDLSTRWWNELSTLWFRADGSLLYESPAINQGKLETTALLLTLVTRVTDVAQWFDSFAGSWFGQHATEWWNDAAAPAAVILEISLSTDGVGFGAFQPYVDGASYKFKAVKLRVTIVPESPTAWVRIETMRLVLDVPDIIKELKDFAVGASGSSVLFSTFGLTFVVVPFVSVTHKGGTVNKIHVINNLTVTGFDIELRDAANALAAGTVDLHIQGF